MRPVFSDEVAREIGYQKYWPEKKDWAIATLGCLAVAGVFCLLIGGILMVTGNWDKQFQPNPCAKYANEKISNLPAGCASYFGVSKLL